MGENQRHEGCRTVEGEVQHEPRRHDRGQPGAGLKRPGGQNPAQRMDRNRDAANDHQEAVRADTADSSVNSPST